MGSAYVQNVAESKEMFSPSTANQFYTIAYELANQKDLSETNAMEAQIFFPEFSLAVFLPRHAYVRCSSESFYLISAI